MAALLPEGKQSFNNSAGVPLVGGKVFTYDAGTSTPRVTYQDAAGTVPNTNPIILDARGEATIFWSGGAYKVVLKDASDGTLWSVDNIIDAADQLRVEIAGPSGTESVGFVQTGVGAVTRTAREKLREIKSFEDVGGIASNTVNQLGLLNAALAQYSHLVINGNVAINPPPLLIPSNTTLEFRHGAKITALSTGPHILGCVASAQNITVLNPEVDGANIRGLNGFGFDTSSALSAAKNIRVINPIARNCLRSSATGGGRGYTIQKNVTSATFINAKAFDCTTGADLNGSASLGPVVGMVIDVLYAENCQEAISIYGDGTNTNSTVPPVLATNSTATIGTVIARNCGRTTDTTLYSGSGVAGDADGGVVVSRRGRNVAINNLTVYNDLGYTIGALFRGVGNNIKINNFEMFGNVQAVCIIGSADNLLPNPNTNDPSYGIALKGRFHNTATNVLDVRISTGTNYITGVDIDVDVSSFPTANAILKTLSSFRNDSKIKVTSTPSADVIQGTLLDVFTYCNTLALATKQRTICSSVQAHSSVTFEDVTTHNDDIVLGSAARVDFSTASAFAGAADGYVLVKVAGVTKKLPVFSV